MEAEETEVAVNVEDERSVTRKGSRERMRLGELGVQRMMSGQARLYLSSNDTTGRMQ